MPKSPVPTLAITAGLTIITSNMKKQTPVLSKWTVVQLLALCVFAFCIVLIFLYKQPVGESDYVSVRAEKADYHKIQAEGVTYHYNSDLIPVLCLGIDLEEKISSGSSDSFIPGYAGQADQITLLLFDRGNKRIRILSLQRDAMVPIRIFAASGRDLGWTTDHLSVSFAYGDGQEKSCLLTAEAVSRLLNFIPIVYFGSAYLSDLPLIHSLAGDLTVTLPNEDLESFGPEYQDGNSITISAANVELFLRYRDSSQFKSDEGRLERQKEYIVQYIAQIRRKFKEQPASMLSGVLNLSEQLVTNLNGDELQDLIQMAADFSFDPQKDFYRLPGQTVSGPDHDEFYIDEEAFQQLVLELFYIS